MQQQLRQPKLHSIFDVANQFDSLTSGSNAAALKRIFRITSAHARCRVGPELSAKYKVQPDNTQHVVSITNMCTLEQTWYNEARTTKPQTFQGSAANLDPTDNGQTLTAKDPGFGRIQLPHAVTASNLFKYAEPSHGVVLFRHHDPLSFSQAALSDLLDASWLWMQESHKLHPHATAPFLLWNCLPRAGASQYHGHAQVMLSSVPVPAIDKLQRAASMYQQQHPGCCYYSDLLKAHAAVGLTRQVTISSGSNSSNSSGSSNSSSGTPPLQQQPASECSSQPRPQVQQQRGQQQPQQHVAWSFASLSPVKDMEVMVVGNHLCCPAFQLMLFAALRGLIEGLGCCTFNVGCLNIDLSVQPSAGVGLSRVYSPSDTRAGPLGGSSSSESGLSDSSSFLRCSAVSSDGLHYLYSHSSSSIGKSSTSDGSNGGCGLWLPNASYWSDRPPVIARLCSRGKLSSAASDFGGLEVWGGGSIGHTDPFAVVEQLDAQLAAAAVVCGIGDARAAAN